MLGDCSARCLAVPKARPTRPPIASSRGSVTSFPGRRCDGVILPRRAASALAGDRDVFVAAGVGAVVARLGNRAGDLVGVDAAVGGGLGEIPRLAIGAGGMGAALLAFGQALVDPVAVGLVGDDEHPAVRHRGRGGRNENTGQNGGYGSHAAPVKCCLLYTSDAADDL